MTIENMKKGEWGKIKAFFDIVTGEGFTMKGFKLVEGANGLFAGFPSQQGKDCEYYDTVWADRELKDQVTSMAVKAYNGEDDDGDAVTSVVVAATVIFPKGVTIYGRWTRVALAASYTHGIIVYYGPQ